MNAIFETGLALSLNMASITFIKKKTGIPFGHSYKAATKGSNLNNLWINLTRID